MPAQPLVDSRPCAQGRRPERSATLPLPADRCGDDPKAVQRGGALAAHPSLASAWAGGSAWTSGFESVWPMPGMLHGFMTRGPLSAPDIARDYAEGVGLMRRFFTAHASAAA